MTACGSRLTSPQFGRSRGPGERSTSVLFLGASALESASACAAQEEDSSFCRRLVEFMELLGAPVGGFIGELGLGMEDGYEREAHILDDEELWRDALRKPERAGYGIFGPNWAGLREESIDRIGFVFLS